MAIASLLFILIYSGTSLAQETCSRIAVVNYQEILVDTGSDGKGEGLRYYLEKDTKAVKLLDEYQREYKPHTWNAAASTVGSGLILAGLLQNDDTDNQGSVRNNLIYSGLLLSVVSFLYIKTSQYNNERILKNAVDQYNKRNSPRIYFSPYSDDNRNFGAGIGVTQEF